MKHFFLLLLIHFKVITELSCRYATSSTAYPTHYHLAHGQPASNRLLKYFGLPHLDLFDLLSETLNMIHEVS